ncbi:11637_t:CDS:1, partial [Rhizophagus irregularis]
GIDDELGKAIEALNLRNRMQVKEFLTIPDENIVYLIPEDQIISEIARLFKSGSDADHPDEVDDSTEVETICINEALKSLKTVHTFLIQQENNASGYMKLMDKIEKFIKREQINLMQQTTINKYFR